VVASFDGGLITSDGGGLLLGVTDRAIGLIERFAGCFVDRRAPTLIEHEVGTLVGQRVFGLALGYEDLNDHDHLRHDPLFAVLAGKLAARRKNCAPVAGKSTLNRLELSRAAPSLYHKIDHDPAAIERLLVEVFVEAHKRPPSQIVLDLDATDDPLHGEQEGPLLPGYRLLLLSALASLRGICWRPSCGGPTSTPRPGRWGGGRIVAQIRQHWPQVRILLRADSGCPARRWGGARPMAWGPICRPPSAMAGWSANRGRAGSGPGR
jgi:hypothetical protein